MTERALRALNHRGRRGIPPAAGLVRVRSSTSRVLSQGEPVPRAAACAACSARAGPCRRTAPRRPRCGPARRTSCVAFAEVIRSRLPCPAIRCRPASVRTGSDALEPGRERDDAADARVVGDVYGGARAHRVTEQDDRDAGMLGRRLLERPARVRDRGGLGSGSGVPAADAEPEQPQREPGVEDLLLEGVPHGRRTPERGTPASRPGPARPSRRRAASARCRAVVRRDPCGRVRVRACVTPIVPGQCAQCFGARQRSDGWTGTSRIR